MYDIIIGLIAGMTIMVVICAWAAKSMEIYYEKVINKLELENERLNRKMKRLIKEK